MYKYFEQFYSTILQDTVSDSQIAEYKKKVIESMQSMGATDDETKIADDDEMIAASIRNNCIPEDTAWAILQ